MEVNTINRVIQTGVVDSVSILPVTTGGGKRLIATMYIRQWDHRKKEEDEGKKVNEFIVKGVGESIKVFEEIQKLLEYKQRVYVMVRGTLQARVAKEGPASNLPVLTNIFVTEADAVEIIPNFILVNEATFAGRIFQKGAIKTKIEHGSKSDPDSIRVLFAVEVGKTLESENPFAGTKQLNVFFCIYKPKNKEGFESIKRRFFDKGRDVFLTGALISKPEGISRTNKHTIAILVREIKISKPRSIIIKVYNHRRLKHGVDIKSTQ
jgi:hypothetical protein